MVTHRHPCSHLCSYHPITCCAFIGAKIFEKRLQRTIKHIHVFFARFPRILLLPRQLNERNLYVLSSRNLRNAGLFRAHPANFSYCTLFMRKEQKSASTHWKPTGQTGQLRQNCCALLMFRDLFFLLHISELLFCIPLALS
jgi:hypothetical protein